MIVSITMQIATRVVDDWSVATVAFSKAIALSVHQLKKLVLAQNVRMDYSTK